MRAAGVATKIRIEVLLNKSQKVTAYANLFDLNYLAVSNQNTVIIGCETSIGGSSLIGCDDGNTNSCLGYPFTNL